MYKDLGAENCSGGEIQWPATAAAAAHQNPPSKATILLWEVFYIQW
jgi:hypothetical protein